MGCGCKRNRERYLVQLKGGLKIPKGSEAEAKSFAAQHPGSKVIKPGS
jgi:hypothetical protein